MFGDIKVKCGACEEISPKSEWKPATIRVINGKRTFVGGCPNCKGEFYDEIKTDEVKHK